MTFHTPSRTTPGRRRNANKENVYFEPGKYGRKTGVTLKDTGKRDEYGFEPLEGIFSSPIRAIANDAVNKKTRHSINGDFGAPLQPRKTPRLPPPRSQTPRHTNIGGSPLRSPARRSSVKPPSPMHGAYSETPTHGQSRPYPKENIMDSIERDAAPRAAQSAKSVPHGRARKSIFDVMSPDTPRLQTVSSPAPGVIDEISQVLSTDDNVMHDAEPMELHDSGAYVDEDQSLPQLYRTGDITHVTSHTGSNTKRKRDSIRYSDVSAIAIDPELLAMGSSDKTAHLEDTSHAPIDLCDDDEQSSQHLQNTLPTPDSSLDVDQQSSDPGETALTAASKRGRKRKSFVNPRRRNAATNAAPARKRDTTSVPLADRESEGDDEEEDAGTNRMGGFRLRSATPFEDAGVKVTRSGRASIKPLAYWKNETIVWKHGEMDGIVRAHEIERAPAPRKSRKAGAKRRRRNGDGADSDDGYESLHEDLLPEKWEDEVGVIRGPVTAWDHEYEAPIQDEEVEEDVAFASSHIQMREVSGAFTYAKVISNDFFGAGVVELPPLGCKRSKNSQKMATSFFVHEGKVAFTVADMEFGLTPGGIVHVPRGNNYSIVNESSVFPAKIFFAQGCAVRPPAATVYEDH